LLIFAGILNSCHDKDVAHKASPLIFCPRQISEVFITPGEKRFTSKEYPTSIDEWLSLSPLGQAAMFLVPNKKIEGLPLDVQFVVQTETADGLLLSDTTRVITITE
jgi:hypothetical protein